MSHQLSAVPLQSCRRRLSRLLQVIVSVLVSLALADLGFRVFWLKRLTIGSGSEHPTFHHRPKPYSTSRYQTKEFDVTITTNRYGLRGPDPVVPKPDGVTRILMLGDSFTFGFPVRDEETFCHLIEAGLRARGLRAEVVNGGVSGYSPTLSYISLRDQFLTFEPGLVVLWFDLGDVTDDNNFQRNLRYDAQGHLLGADPRYLDGRFNWWQWTVNHSALARWINNKPVASFRKMRILGLGGYLRAAARGERAKFAIARLRAQQGGPDAGKGDRFVLVREWSTPELVRPAWAASAKYLHLIHELLAARGIPFVLGVYPYGMNAGPDEWEKGRKFWGFAPGRTYDYGAAQTVYRQFSASERIPLIDTFDDFRTAAAATTGKLFYDHDGHLTPAGQQVIAEHTLNDREFLELVRRLSGRRGRADAASASRDAVPAGAAVALE